MENYTRTTRFILSANYSSKVIDPIQSRCTIFRFKPLDKKDIIDIIDRIAHEEKLHINDQAKHALFEASEGDCRRLENIMQSCAALDKKITEETGATIDIDDDGQVKVACVDGPMGARAVDMIKALTEDPEVGRIYNGKVVRIANFGAFVDLGGMDGLVHVSELSWQHVSHPSEVVNVGDEVTVKVLEVDRDRERISLSIRQTREDPWESFSAANEVGDIVEGKVTKTVPFGAFVSVTDGVEGLVHVSEIAMHHVESPELELTVGQATNMRITEIDEEIVLRLLAME